MRTSRPKVTAASWLLPTMLTLMASEKVLANAIDIGGEGSQAWEVCALCHGANGISVMDKFPKLAGQNYDYLVKQIKDFRAQRRTNDGGQMAVISTEIEESQIAGIADYFSGLPPPEPEKSLDTGEIERHRLGGKLYQKHCASCHDDGNTAPRLRGQHQRYLAKQLHDFRDGRRVNDSSGQMQLITRNLDVNTLETITLYLATQPGAQR